MDRFTPTERTRLGRLPARAVDDREQVYAILDEARVCHVGFCVEGQPYVIPTGYARRGDRLLIHGSPASRMMRSLAGGIDVCITVTLLDGLVLARSAFHHSMNYRSVVILGRARLLAGPAEKMEALGCFTDHIVPGRWAEVRPPNEQELKATTVLVLPLEEVSAKIRTGGPVDDAADLAIPAWAGVVPLRTIPGDPIPAPDLAPATPPLDLARFRR